MTTEIHDEVVVPHLYIDSNVFARILEGQHRPSIHLLETIRENDWRCSTSVLTAMELSEIRKEDKFISNKRDSGMPIRRIFRLLDQKDLTYDDVRSAQDRIDTLFRESYQFVKFHWLEKPGWDRAVDLCATTNISPSDCIHLAIAIEAGCDVLVTLDTFFNKEVNKEMDKQTQPPIRSCLPEQVTKTLKDLKFDI